MTHHIDLLAKIRTIGPAGPVPGLTELSDHLRERIEAAGDTAFQEFAYLKSIAATIWGPERTSHFAIVLRNARVSPKASRNSRWTRPRTAIERLPSEWREAMCTLVDGSEARSAGPGSTVWSADYASAVITALCHYADYAKGNNMAIVPNGGDLDRYARWFTDTSNTESRISIRAAADYLSRIKAGLAIVAPSSSSSARDFVVRYWREQAKSAGTSTKTGDQLVGAVAIYDLGFNLIERARSLPMRGVRAATIFRNGLILSTGIALPQRARAISSLAYDTTLTVVNQDTLHARIPAEMLKMREDRKDGDPFDMVWHNWRLVDALNEYRRYFRPLFDEGTCLFPSVLARGQSISEKQIGLLTARLTKEEFKVAIPIHRLRDNAATEASENLTGGRFATAALLGHTELATGDHYDHSNNKKAAAAFDDFINHKRSAPVDLAL